MRKFGRVDRNQKSLVAQLRCIPGVTVFSTATIGNGFADLAVGYKGRTFLFEVKDGSKPPSARKLKPLEQKFATEWRGHLATVTCLSDCLRELGLNP